MIYTVYSKPNCGHCATMKQLIKDSENEYIEINMPDLDATEQGKLRTDAMVNHQRMMPLIYLDGKFILNSVLEEELNGEIR